MQGISSPKTVKTMKTAKTHCRV